MSPNSIKIFRKNGPVLWGHYKVHIKEDLQYSADSEARWIKKGKISTYGYKGFAIVGGEGSLSPKRLLGDKGYASQKNRALLREKGIKNGLMYKAKRGKPLTNHQKKFNKLISKTRFRVEQCFGTLKRQFHMVRSSYMGLMATWGQFTAKAIAFNLNKALRQVKWV